MTGRAAEALRPYRRAFFAMGSDCEIFLLAHGDASAAVMSAEAEVRRIEGRFSRYRADSEMSRINVAAAAGHWTRIDRETAWLLRCAVMAYAASDGAFDVTSGVLRAAWDFTQAHVADASVAGSQMPDQGTLDALRQRIGMDKLRLAGVRLSFSRGGMELDFGGLGKEYAADRAAAVLRAAGMRHGFVNLSGDIAVVGPQPDGSPWRIGISEPGARERAVTVMPLGSGGLATSGDYERCSVIAGRRYSHILDPRTGWPGEGLASVTVVAKSCLDAGIMATTSMAKGTAGLAWLQARGCRYVTIDADGATSGTEAMDTT